MVENKEEALKELKDLYKKFESTSQNDIKGNVLPIKKEKRIKREVILFFSFDVVNSTMYKTINYFGWAQVLNGLFRKLRDSVYIKISNAEMWRVLGDEIIFITKIRDEEELRNNINAIFRILVKTIGELKNGIFFEPANKNYNLHRLQNILSLKAAAWIAVVDDIGDISDRNILDDIDAENIFEKYQSQEGNEIFEFLGNDIDTGFRIAKQTEDGRLVLSFELAYLISRQTEGLSYLHTISYRKLKGVWKDKLYPIIWYHDPKAYQELEEGVPIQFKDSFTFDAFEESDLISDYFNVMNQSDSSKSLLDSKMYEDPKYALEKILCDRRLEKKIKRMQQQIKQVAYDQTKYIDPEKIQVHCVAVCYKIERGEEISILVAKRHNKRKKMQGKWEFGCAKAVINKSIAERIKEEYKQDFNIDITPVIDTKREIREPIPIALYQVIHKDDSQKTDKGIITLARIDGEYKIENFKQTDKHTEVAWVQEKDLENLEEKFDNVVPDFKCTLMEAFKRIKELEGTNGRRKSKEDIS